jgi:transposase
VKVYALRKRGWSISAIARHTGFDRKTVRKYLARKSRQQNPGCVSSSENWPRVDARILPASSESRNEHTHGVDFQPSKRGLIEGLGIRVAYVVANGLADNSDARQQISCNA